jgi:hypothetical protein
LNGTLIKEILLGDGIKDMKVTDKEVIWTSYFDEGVFENYGWDEPIGSCGLPAWNQDGDQYMLIITLKVTLFAIVTLSM